MSTWTEIPDSALEPDKPVRSVDALAFRDNPVAIAQRAANAPWVQVPQKVYFTVSGTWPIPDEVSAWNETIVGGGGGLNIGDVGGDSSTAYNSLTVTAEGGEGDEGAGGATINADLGIPGAQGVGTVGGESMFGFPSGLASVGFGSGGNGGSGGGTAYKRRVRVDGMDSVAVVVGAAGSGQARPGLVIIEY